MAYFLGSDVKVALTTESESYGINVTETTNNYSMAVTATITNGIEELSASNLATGSALLDVTGVDLGIGAMDEDIAYMGHRTPLKAEVHKETTVSLSLKKKNGVYDCIFTGDKDGNIGRWGVTGSALADGLSEPSIEYGFRLAIHIKGAKECFTVRNAVFTGHSISLNADGTQEETLEFSSQVEPVIKDGAYATATTGAQL